MTKSSDRLNSIAKERGFARQALMVDILPRATYARYECDDLDTPRIGYAHHNSEKEKQIINIISADKKLGFMIMGFVK